jgi:hypothetical protein
MRRSVKDINFYSTGEDGAPNFIDIEDFDFISPSVKDYVEKAMPLLSH